MADPRVDAPVGSRIDQVHAVVAGVWRSMVPLGVRGRRLTIGWIVGVLAATTCGGPDGPGEACVGAPGDGPMPAIRSEPPSGPLRPDPSGRFLVTARGEPFFWLGDTAWTMPSVASERDIDRYLRDRHDKGFDVVQVLVGRDTKDGPYWARVDHLVDRASSLGIYVAIVPCWHCFEDIPGCWGCQIPASGIETSDIEAYGEFLGARYGPRAVVWLLGGDGAYLELTTSEADRYSTLAHAIERGAGGADAVLIGFQPTGATSSSRWVHDEAWLDFNTLQSGHELDMPSYDMIAGDLQRTPPKPTHEGESIYEDIPERFWDDVHNPRATAWDARKGAYWGVFAGGFGHTYGGNGVWSWTLASELRDNCCNIRYPWYEALDLPGASQMQHLRRLIGSRPFLSRIPDQTIVTSDPGAGSTRVQATRDADGSYAFVYITDGHEVSVDMSTIACGDAAAWWFDPRTGSATEIGTFPNEGSRDFTPPSHGTDQDWVLVLDDVTRSFPPPGAAPSA